RLRHVGFPVSPRDYRGLTASAFSLPWRSAEEAFISFDFEPFELSLGKQFTPFGLYYSNFITGPMLEFGETRAPHMAQLSFAYADQLELNIAAYDGWAQPQGQGDRLDWAIGFEHLPLHGFSWGLSYQTDLADADEHLIEDNRYAQRVSALSGFVSGYTEYFGCSFEILSAMGEFQEQDAKYNRPQAWNLEFSYFPPAMDFDVALRLEMSRELEDQPEVQYGVATTWYLNRQIIVMLEYLHGRFRTETDVTEREESFSEIQRVNSLNAKLSIEF
ncbi:MAG: hypothetical protein ABW095_17945, partial [Candidatus Thiodiazotropha sp.]